jgi:pyocin large subunit-like protein
MLKKFSRFSILILICFFALSCNSRDTQSSTSQETRKGSAAAGVQAHDFAPGQLEAHYRKHGEQLGAITIDRYLDQARDLLDTPAGNDILEKVRPNGDILHYRVSTGEFAVMTPRGRIRTYFKTNLRYWMKQ